MRFHQWINRSHITKTTNMNKLKIGDKVWHPCSMDIIEHKVIAVHEYEKFTHYTTKALRNVGACGQVEVILDEHKGKLRFVELLREDELKYASGLQDFVEGDYYSNESEAKLRFYEKQLTIFRFDMQQKEALYNEAKRGFEKVELIINKIKEELKWGD